MSKKSKRRVYLFISYSREDEKIIKPIVQLLRLTESKFFLDVESIAPGDRWQQKLEVALNKADKICVFWCLHSKKSEWVEREWRSAHRMGKKIIPLLLDSTPLTPELSEYQYIDFFSGIEGSLHPMDNGFYSKLEPRLPSYSVEDEYNHFADRVVSELIPMIEMG